MNAICLLVAGALRAALPTDSFTLAWAHSVEKTRWEEDYRIEGDRLVLEESRVEGFGAGMEPAPGARLARGVWRWRPAMAPLAELRLTSSTYTEDYAVCWKGRCRALRAIAHSSNDEVISVVPCAR